jgi:hypothetical protein
VASSSDTVARNFRALGESTKKGLEVFGLRTSQIAQKTFRQAGSTFNSLTRSMMQAVRRPILVNQCKKEATERPCPRILLVCCTAMTVAGLDTPGLFDEVAARASPQAEAINEEVASLLQLFESTQGATILPEGTSIVAVSLALKQFLAQLPEPLLTFKLYRDFLGAAQQPQLALDLLSELPLAALNR